VPHGRGGRVCTITSLPTPKSAQTLDQKLHSERGRNRTLTLVYFRVASTHRSISYSLSYFITPRKNTMKYSSTFHSSYTSTSNIEREESSGHDDSSSCTDHIAVVILCHEATNFVFRTIKECALHFTTVHVLGYGSNNNNDDVPIELKQMVVRLDMELPNETNVLFSFHTTPHKQQALYEGCQQLLVSTNTKKQYTHIMLVDVKVGARPLLLQDVLSQKTDIPVCAYYYYSTDTSTSPDGSGTSTMVSSLSKQSSRTNRIFPFSSLSSSRRKQCNKPGRRRRMSIPPTFVDDYDENKPNHFMDVWESNVLLELLRQHCTVVVPPSLSTGRRSLSKSSRQVPPLLFSDQLQTTFCSLQTALLHSSTRAVRRTIGHQTTDTSLTNPARRPLGCSSTTALNPTSSSP
jgi:hypothetical protein